LTIYGLTDPGAVLKALAEFDEVGGLAFRQVHEFGPSTRYYLHHGGRLYDAKAIAGVAYGYQHPATGALSNKQLDGGEAGANKVLRRLGFTVADSHCTTADEERTWRQTVWDDLVDRRNDAGLVTPDAVRSVGAYGSFRGIWVDSARTKKIHPAGIAVGLKHTGQHYPDEFSDTGALYHYPVTGRPGHDLAEINATKVAAELALPVFVIREVGDLRGVRLAWVEGWEDESRLFLVRFGEAAPERIIDQGPIR
jgi:hypothetical protein